jgi:AcrR family transcriptional regulator
MTLRERQKEEGRRLVREAAVDLFFEDGYIGTTVKSIAARAGVAERTFYNLFETKAGLLLDIVRDRIAGSQDDPIEADHAHLESLSEPAEMIEYFGEITRRVAQRALPLLKVAYEAAVVDGEVAKRLASQEEYRFEHQTILLKTLSQKGFLRTDEPFEYLRMGFWLLAGPEMAIKATVAGWDLDTYQRWLIDTLQGLLLGGAPTDNPN